VRCPTRARSAVEEWAMFFKAGIELEEQVAVLSREIHAIQARSLVEHLAAGPDVA